MGNLAVAATGTQLQIGDGGGPENFATIAEVKDISGPAFSTGTEETTSHDSNSYRDFIATLKEVGEITFKLNFNNHATQGFTGGLYLDWVNRTKRNFKLVIPTTVPKTGAFNALVTSFKFDLPVEGAITADVTLKVNGAVAWS